MFGIIRHWIMKESHNTLPVRHPGQCCTRALIEAIYYWPRMREDIVCYVQTCLVCQQGKVKQRQPGEILEPLPVAKFYGRVLQWTSSLACQSLTSTG